MPTRRRLVVPLGLAALSLVAVLWWMTRVEEDEAAVARLVGEAGGDAVASLPNTEASAAPAGASGFAAPAHPLTLPGEVALIAEAGTPGSLLVHVRWKEGGTPASDIGLRLLQLDRADPQFHATLGRSGPDGRWLLADLQPGRVMVYSDRVEAQAGRVVAGEQLELTIELLAGVLVRGTVIDGEQRPVPDAEIWLDGQHVTGAIMTVARADNVGRFTVRDVQYGQSVGASARDHTRSTTVFVERMPDPLDIVLELGPQGGRLHGVVLDPGGAPVAAATVLVGPALQFHPPPPIRVLTDERGEFVADDVPAGKAGPLAVRATGWSPWTGHAQVAVGETTEIEVVLPASASLTGVVRNAAGQPLADVHVGTETGSEMQRRYVFSDPEGRYELHDLPLGRTELSAYKDGAGRAETTLTIEPGGRYAWDPVLGAGPVIRGRIVDERGEARAGSRIRAIPEQEPLNGRGIVRHAKSDAGGRFLIDDCTAGRYRLEIDARAADGLFAVATRTGVLPGSDEIEIVVAALAPASVVGRVLDPQGRALAGASIVLVEAIRQTERQAKSEPASGGFRIDALQAGRYSLEVEAEGLARLSLPEFELAAGEVHDVGTLSFETPGTVLVRVTLPEGADPVPPGGFLIEPARRTAASLELQPDGSLLSPPVEAGDYTLRVFTPRAFASDRSVSVRSGERTEVAVALSRCLSRQLELALAAAHGPTPQVSVTVVDVRGEILGELPVGVFELDDGARSAVAMACLPPGDYRVRFRIDAADVLDAPLHVEEDGERFGIERFQLP